MISISFDWTEEKEPEHCFKKTSICDQVTIPEKGTHEATALAVSNQTGIDEREIQKVTRLLFGKKSSWFNFRHILPQSIQTSAAYNPRSLTRKQPCLSQAFA